MSGRCGMEAERRVKRATEGGWEVTAEQQSPRPVTGAPAAADAPVTPPLAYSCHPESLPVAGGPFPCMWCATCVLCGIPTAKEGEEHPRRVIRKGRPGLSGERLPRPRP